MPVVPFFLYENVHDTILAWGGYYPAYHSLAALRCSDAGRDEERNGQRSWMAMRYHGFVTFCFCHALSCFTRFLSNVVHPPPRCEPPLTYSYSKYLPTRATITYSACATRLVFLPIFYFVLSCLLLCTLYIGWELRRRSHQGRRRDWPLLTRPSRSLETPEAYR